MASTLASVVVFLAFRYVALALALVLALWVVALLTSLHAAVINFGGLNLVFPIWVFWVFCLSNLG